MSDEAGTDRGVPPGYEALGSSDRASVLELVQRGADMRKPRHALHRLSFASEAEAEQASAAATKAGWQVSTSEPDDGGRWMLTCEKDDYVLLARIIHADTRFFDGLAKAGHGEHDGWEASVN